MSRPRVVIEVAARDEKTARDLAAGGIFVPACDVPLNDDCELLVVTAAGDLVLDARVVFQAPTGGAGLELVGFGPALRDQLTQLLADAAARTAALQFVTDDEVADDVPPGHEAGVDEVGHARSRDELTLGDELTLADEPASRAARARDDGARDDTGEDRVMRGSAGDDSGDGDRTGDDGAGDDRTGDRTGDDSAGDDRTATDGSNDDTTDDTGEAGAPRAPIAKNLHERLRGLTLAEQVKKAHSPDPAERMALERMYGKAVWEALLRNPRLTAPEVSRIARMGSLPRPMIEVIVGNGSWLQVAEVRRALLSNPRLGTDQILRVLRLMPKHELKLASTMTAYPHAVRDAAKRLLKDA